MTATAKLPKKFWAEALLSAVYICPTKAVKGMKLNVSNLHTFGCVAFAHVPKDE